MLRRYANFVAGTFLTSAIDASQTNLPVNSTAGFPAVPFVLAIANDGLGGGELVLCTAIPDGTNFTVEREYDGTTGVAADASVLVEHTTAAIDYREAGIARIDTSERDALAGDDLWEGRVIYNTEAERIDVNTSSGWMGVLPVGAMIPFTALTLPDGFLWADGTAILRASYPELDALYFADGYPYGDGDASTTFNLPDMRQRFPLGVAESGTGATIGDEGGLIDHVHTGPSHTHGSGTLATDSQGAHTHTNPSTSTTGAHTHTNPNTGSSGSHAHTNPTTSSAGDHTHTNPTTSSSGGHAHFLDGGATAAAGGHSHSFSDSFTTGGPSSIPLTQSGSGQQLASSSHTHSGSVSGTTGSVSSHVHGYGTLDTDLAGAHTHTQSSTGTSGSHTHAQSNTGSDGSHVHSVGTSGSSGDHSHTQGVTGSSGDHAHSVTSGATGAAGTGNTGVANPPFLAVPWIVRY